MVRIFSSILFFTLKSLTSGLYKTEKKIIFFLSLLFLTSEAFKGFICSYLASESEKLSFNDGCLYLVYLICFIWVYKRIKMRKKGLTNYSRKGYLYALSINKFNNLGDIINIQKFNFIVIFSRIKYLLVNLISFLKITVFKNMIFFTNSNNYSKLNKNFKRYSEILKKYL